MGQLSIDLTSRRQPLIGIEEVAEWLGVSVRHVRRLVDEDRIPYLKWAERPLRFDPVEIEAWLDLARRGASAR